MSVPSYNDEPPRGPLGPVARAFAYFFVIGAGLLVGGVAGFIVALFSGLIPITC
jgi:hypothetical protein